MSGHFDTIPTADLPCVLTFQKGCADSGALVHQFALFLQISLVQDFACLNVRARSAEEERTLLALDAMQLLLS